MTPSVVESTDIVRKRRFTVRSIEEVVEVLRQMKRERFQGVVKFELRCGGTPTSVEVEERSKIVVDSERGHQSTGRDDNASAGGAHVGRAAVL